MISVQKHQEELKNKQLKSFWWDSSDNQQPEQQDSIEETSAAAAQNDLEEQESSTSTTIMGVAPDFQAQYKKDLVDQALADIVEA